MITPKPLRIAVTATQERLARLEEQAKAQPAKEQRCLEAAQALEATFETLHHKVSP